MIPKKKMINQPSRVPVVSELSGLDLPVESGVGLPIGVVKKWFISCEIRVWFSIQSWVNKAQPAMAREFPFREDVSSMTSLLNALRSVYGDECVVECKFMFDFK